MVRGVINAAIYCRISKDAEGLGKRVEDQEADCRELAERQGYTVASVYVDNDISASRFTRKTRPQYQAMLAAARRGGIHVIIAYSNSRLVRRPLQLEELIQIHDEHGVRFVTVVSGQDDLSTADGRMVARIKASIDAAEADRISERIRRAFQQDAHDGKRPNGGRPFGWQADKLTPDPLEAAAIRDAAAQVLAGVPLRAIARAWNTRGLTTARGSAWDHGKLRSLLRQPRLVGWRTHHGETLTRNGAPVAGEWEPILDPDTFDRLHALLESRVGTRREARTYLLSGLARCSVCGRRMFGGATPRGWNYRCNVGDIDNPHTVTVDGPRTDGLILALVKHLLAEEDLTTVPPPPPGAQRSEQIPDLIAELMAAFNAGRLSGSVVFPQVEKLEAELAGLRAERARWAASTTVAPVAADDLDRLGQDRQRVVVESLLEAVVVAPAARKGQHWTPDRLTAVWR